MFQSDQELSAGGGLTVIEELISLGLGLGGGFGEDEFHFLKLPKVDVETGLRPAGEIHDVFAGENRTLHLHEDVKQITGGKGKVVEGDAQYLRGETDRLFDVGLIHFDVFDVFAALDRLLHLIEESYGLAEVQELRLVSSCL